MLSARAYSSLESLATPTAFTPGSPHFHVGTYALYIRHRMAVINRDGGGNFLLVGDGSMECHLFCNTITHIDQWHGCAGISNNVFLCSHRRYFSLQRSH